VLDQRVPKLFAELAGGVSGVALMSAFEGTPDMMLGNGAYFRF
jgi:hypothetical protein